MRIVLAGAVLAAIVSPAGARELLLRYHHRPGEQYRIVGVNRQRVTLDGVHVGNAEVLTRIQIVKGDDREIHATYQVSEESTGTREAFALEREYDVRFFQDELGIQRVPAGSFVPQVRDVPTFPEEPVRPGDIWQRPAREIYDFREGLGIQDPVVIPMDVSYEYRGTVPFEEGEFEEIAITYNLFHRPQRNAPEAREIRLITARFRQKLLWDHAAGRPHYYEETYNLFIQLTDGTRLEYQGEADGRVVGAPPLNRAALEEEISASIRDQALADTTVRSDEQGVTIALEDIRFAPDSARILDSELVKLDWLAALLRRHGDRDILITGHTALAGTEEGRQRLSEERAAAVGTYLLNSGVRTREQMMYRGLGATQPVASNATEEGRRRNRRVEITILEN